MGQEQEHEGVETPIKGSVFIHFPTEEEHPRQSVGDEDRAEDDGWDGQNMSVICTW